MPMRSDQSSPTLPTLNALDVQGHIGQLWVHPVKSCSGISVEAARLLPTGLEWDREWMVVDERGDFVTQRELPGMALVQPRLSRHHLHLNAPGMSELTLPLLPDSCMPRLSVRVWDDELLAFDVGVAAATWFSAFFAGLTSIPDGLKRLRLVRFDPSLTTTQPRLSSLSWTHGQPVPNLFGDGFPVLVASQASLQGLNRRLLAAGECAVDMRRFRPNVVLDGVDEHDEDRLDTLHFHAHVALPAQTPPVLQPLELALTKPCARCPIPNVNPDTAQTTPAVGDALRTYRSDPRLNGAITFGMNAFACNPLPPSGLWLAVGQPFGANWRFD